MTLTEEPDHTPQADVVRAWSPEARARMIAMLRAEFSAGRPLGPDAWTLHPIAEGATGVTMGTSHRGPHVQKAAKP
jgi:hypothetical protein